MRLLEMVGEERMKTPPPEMLTSRSRFTPLPFLIVNPSIRSALVNPPAKTTTEHCVDPTLGVQKSLAGSGGSLAPRIHGLPVPSIVVTHEPPVDTTDTPGVMRSDAVEVPGDTETGSPADESHMA